MAPTLVSLQLYNDARTGKIESLTAKLAAVRLHILASESHDWNGTV
jgi:hypothetical protein